MRVLAVSFIFGTRCEQHQHSVFPILVLSPAFIFLKYHAGCNFDNLNNDAAAVFQRLSALTGLQTLDLSGMHSCIVLKCLCAFVLYVMRVSGNKFDRKAAIAVGGTLSALTALRELNLSGDEQFCCLNFIQARQCFSSVRLCKVLACVLCRLFLNACLRQCNG